MFGHGGYGGQFTMFVCFQGNVMFGHGGYGGQFTMLFVFRVM